MVVSWGFIYSRRRCEYWVRIIGHLSQNFHTSFSSLRGSFFYSHPPLSQLIQMVVSWGFYSKCIKRVHTSRLVALGGEGREEVTCGAWHTFQHHTLFLSGHGLLPRYLWWFSRPNGTCQRNPLSRREKVTDVSRPKGKLAAPPPNHPRTLIIAFSAASIEVSLRLQCLWDLETTGKATRRHPSNG